MTTTVKAFHQAVMTAIAEHFTGKVQVLAYPLETSEIQTPAVLLEMESAEEGQDPGDGRIALQCRMAAHCVLGFQTEHIGMEVRSFSSQLFTLIVDNKFGIGGDVSWPEGLEMHPGEFKTGKAGFESWCVIWEQTLYLGESEWDDSGIVPETVMLGIAPNIGAAHEEDYRPVNALPTV